MQVALSQKYRSNDVLRLYGIELQYIHEHQQHYDSGIS